jgi:hypothetical protein
MQRNILHESADRNLDAVFAALRAGALHEKALKIREIMRRANIVNEEACR